MVRGGTRHVIALGTRRRGCAAWGGLLLTGTMRAIVGEEWAVRFYASEQTELISFPT